MINVAYIYCFVNVATIFFVCVFLPINKRPLISTDRHSVSRGWALVVEGWELKGLDLLGRVNIGIILLLGSRKS